MLNLKFFIFLSVLFVVDAKLDCRCSPNTDNRIVQGERAASHEIPWQLSLGFLKDGKISHICGAALLNGDWLMTAAHCVFGFKRVSDYWIGYGTSDLKEMTDDKRIQAAEIYIHPEYNGESPSEFGDIAVIKLSQTIQLNSTVSPSCLLRKPSDFDVMIKQNLKKILTASGFGSITRTYKWIVGPLFGGKISRYLKKANFYVDEENKRDDLICIKPVTEGDSVCNGDSGGPLMVVVPSSNKDNNSTDTVSNKMCVVGLTSYGSGDRTMTGYVYFCNGSACYTKVPYHNDFLTDYIDENELCYVT